MWVKPTQMNDWGYLTVHLGQPSLSAFGTWNHRTSDVPVMPPGTYRVRWPDGTEETVDVYLREVTTRVSDHGHSYTVRSQVPHLTVSYHGLEQKLPLTKTGVEVWVPKP